MALGSFVVSGSGQTGRRGVVVAAPHGSSDARTGEMATEFGRRTGFGVVVATGFGIEPDTREGPGWRFLVQAVQPPSGR